MMMARKNPSCEHCGGTTRPLWFGNDIICYRCNTTGCRKETLLTRSGQQRTAKGPCLALYSQGTCPHKVSP